MKIILIIYLKKNDNNFHRELHVANESIVIIT